MSRLSLSRASRSRRRASTFKASCATPKCIDACTQNKMTAARADFRLPTSDFRILHSESVTLQSNVEKLYATPAWTELQQKFFESCDPAPVLAGLTALIDQRVLEAYQESLAPAFPDSLAILAVGGYGRCELFPYSDVDILILLERESQAAGLKDPLAEFVRLLWDRGLRLSHSVRTIEECAELHEQNIELNISLLDRRLLGGSSDLYAKLEAKLAPFFERRSRTLAQHLARLARTRHHKYQETIYHLEPDIKETP